MNSPTASRSEGEYLSSDSEVKATKPPPSRNDNRVNRHSRTHSHAPARRSRSRSRSPYRAPRGEKRRRDEPHHSARHDPRTFSVRYEDDRKPRYDSSSGHRSKRSRTYSPGRSRSRSPFRHDKINDNIEKEDLQKKSTQSVSTRDLKSDGVPQSESNAKPVEQTQVQQYPESTTEDAKTTLAPALLDEAAIIEARRKRREAIKNQHRGQAPSLLAQALGLGPDTAANSLSSTPNRSGEKHHEGSSQYLTPSVSPSPAPLSTPGTPAPLDHSAPQSPVTNPGKDEGMDDIDMFGSPRQADEPSAADYDPTADMQDERARHDKRLFKEDQASEEQADQQVRGLANTAPKPLPKAEKKAEFDMFAEEDDDDDMFAENSTQTFKPQKVSAQTLDEGMMDNWDDAEGYYLTNLREKIDDRYEVTANLGRGMFASVIRASDVKTKKLVAIKIIRNNETMKKAGLKEVDILKDLAANDADDRKHIVRLLRSFDHKGHLCMVFENMDMNLREVLKKFGRDIGLNLKAIRAYAQQLFLGLSLLKKCQYLHADLKPDNILADESRMKIKIADLGSASPITENATAPYLVSRFYRAPEIILGIEYDYGIDMWSTGCTLFELYTGKILFTGRNNNNMLKTVMECRGKFPHKLLRKGTLTYEYFDDLLNFKSQEQDKATGRIVTKMIDIKAKPVRDLRSRLMPKDKRVNEQEKKELELFADLLDKCLDLRPEKRITPNEALKHPFITRAK